MNDPIADMLTRIRNAAAVGKPSVRMPYSKLKHALAEILVAEGYLERAERIAATAGAPDQASRFDQLHLAIRYRDSQSKRRPAVTSLRRISTPGRRVYVGSDALPRVRNGIGTAVISTPRGLMTARDAHRSKLGGEVLCEVY